MSLVFQVSLGFGLSLLAAVAAWRMGWLSRSGAAAACLLGGLVFGFGGWAWAALLLSFFFSSSLLSRVGQRRKQAVEQEKFAKGARRDWGQVAANGGAAAFFVLLHLAFPQSIWPWLAFAGSLAAANADTWATELGVLSRAAPRLITNGKVVEQGTSGGISTGGTLAALGGAGLIGLLSGAMLSWAAPGAEITPIAAGAVITLAGLGGSLVDSLLGATVQAMFFCPACGKETERHPLHRCGTATLAARGWAWMNNDLVNGLCTLSGGALSAALGCLLALL